MTRPVDRDELRTWVKETCDAQGVPEKVTDPAVVAQVVTLLTAGERRPAPARKRSEHGRSAGPDVTGATPE